MQQLQELIEPKIELKDLKIGDFVEFVDLGMVDTNSGAIELSESAKWYCAVVRPACHARVSFELHRLGFRAFYPRTRRWVSHARTKKAVERPILGPYVFVEVDHPRQSFSAVRGLFDVDHMVSNLGKPSPFPSHWVEGLLGRYMAGEWDEVTHGKVPVGARIRIVEGEFNDQYATVVSIKGNRLEAKILGRSHSVRLSQCSVRAA